MEMSFWSKQTLGFQGLKVISTSGGARVGSVQGKTN